MPSRGDRVNQKTGNREKPLFVYPSPDEAQRYRRELQDALEAVRERRFPHSDALIWPAGLDRSIVAGHLRSRRARTSSCATRDSWRVTIRSPRTKSCASRTSAGGQFATSSSQWTNSSASTSRASREDLAPASVVAMRLRMEVEKLTPREVLIVERRVLSRPRKTLKEIAAQFGVSTRSGRATHPLPARYMSRRNSIPTGQQEVGDRRRSELRAETFLHPAQTVESPSSALAEPPAEP